MSERNEKHGGQPGRISRRCETQPQSPALRLLLRVVRDSAVLFFGVGGGALEGSVEARPSVSRDFLVALLARQVREKMECDWCRLSVTYSGYVECGGVGVSRGLCLLLRRH